MSDTSSSAPSAPAVPSSTSGTTSSGGGTATPANAPAVSAASKGLSPAEKAAAAKPAAPKPDAPAKTEAQRIKLRLKIDGEEREEELTHDEIAARLQKHEAANRRFQEAAESRRQVAEREARFKADPFAAASELGLNLEELAEKRIAEKYREELKLREMTEDQRRAHEAEKKLSVYEKQKAEREEAEKTAAAERLKAETYSKVETQMKADIGSALQSLGMDASYEVLSEIARLGKQNIVANRNLAPHQRFYPTAAQLAQEAKAIVDARFERLEQSAQNGLDGEALIKRLGPTVVKKILQASVAKFKKPEAVSKPPRQVEPPAENRPAVSPARQKMLRRLGIVE